MAPERPAMNPAVQYSQPLTGVKSFFRLVDGLRTLFLVGRDGQLLDIVDVRQWASVAIGNAVLPAPCPVAYEAHARATLLGGHVSVVLCASHEIRVLAEGSAGDVLTHPEVVASYLGTSEAVINRSGTRPGATGAVAAGGESR